MVRGSEPGPLFVRVGQLGYLDTIRVAIAVVDLVAIPGRPSPHDLRRVTTTLALLQKAGKPCVLVVNGATPRASSIAARRRSRKSLNAGEISRIGGGLMPKRKAVSLTGKLLVEKGQAAPATASSDVAPPDAPDMVMTTVRLPAALYQRLMAYSLSFTPRRSLRQMIAEGMEEYLTKRQR